MSVVPFRCEDCPELYNCLEQFATELLSNQALIDGVREDLRSTEPPTPESLLSARAMLKYLSEHQPQQIEQMVELISNCSQGAKPERRFGIKTGNFICRSAAAQKGTDL